MIFLDTKERTSEEITSWINQKIKEQPESFDILFVCKSYDTDYCPDENLLQTNAEVVIYSDQLKTLQNNAILLEFRKKKTYAVAIDGPSGSGKSTIAKGLADYLQINYLDTGAMYRALTYVILEQSIDVNDMDGIKKLLPRISFTLKDNILFFNEKELGSEIRTSYVTQKVATIASYDFVREHMVKLQREIAKDTSIVVDGRDIGTVVLKNCQYKFFLTASVQVRAKRRYEQWKGKENITYEEVLKDLLERDKRDIHRTVGPLKCAEDAIRIDSSNKTIMEVMEMMIQKIREKSDVL